MNFYQWVRGWDCRVSSEYQDQFNGISKTFLVNAEIPQPAAAAKSRALLGSE
jgi:hypothetical protein